MRERRCWMREERGERRCGGGVSGRVALRAREYTSLVVVRGGSGAD